MIRALGKNKKENRPKNDFYCTPFSLTWELLKRHNIKHAWEPACGQGSIAIALEEQGVVVEATDIDPNFDPSGESNQFFEFTESLSNTIISNPPFSLWDLFVFHSKMLDVDKIMFIGKTDYFSAYSRLKSGIWNGLKHVEIFDRKVDYQTPYREDGLFCVGAMTSAWFIWEKNYTGKPMIDIIDVQPYAKLGAYKKNGNNSKIEFDEKKIEDAKEKKARKEGQYEELLKTLKSFNCESIEDAEKVIENTMRLKQEKERELIQGIEELENNYDWDF